MILLVWAFTFFGSDIQKIDTVGLQEIEVISPAYERFGQGQKSIKWSQKDLEAYQSRSLADLLADQSPVFIRSYGPGMLASPSFRGSSAGHTAVFWNGIPLNSPSLGQSDFSLLPVFAIDQASLQFGSSGALLGNEAIGGSVNLKSQAGFQEKSSLLLSQEFSSFGNYQTNVKGSISGKKLALQSKIYHQFAANKYPFRNLALPGTPIQEQDHAQVIQKGIVADLNWRISDNKSLKTSIWLHQAEREIQPPMGSSTQDFQEDQALRWSMNYEVFKKKSTLSFQSGLVREELIFNEIENNTSQFILGGTWDYFPTEQLSYHSGARITLVKGDLSTYAATDERLEIFQSAKYSPTNRLSLSLNLRQLGYGDQLVPLIPGAGLDWTFLEQKNQSLELKISAGRGFKVPTLNDRFWSPGGNPELLPENSWNVESGLHWKKNSFSQSLTFYSMNVDNWIIWLPQGSFWSPQNIRKVRSDGVEYQGSMKFKTGAVDWISQWQYSLNRAVSLVGISQNDPSLGKQLPYTPRHQAGLSLQAQVQRFSIQAQTNYTGERKITADNPRTLSPFFLADLGISYTGFSISKIQIPLQVRIQNLLNTQFQVIYLRPMPGRSIHFTISFQL